MRRLSNSYKLVFEIVKFIGFVFVLFSWQDIALFCILYGLPCRASGASLPCFVFEAETWSRTMQCLTLSGGPGASDTSCFIESGAQGHPSKNRPWVWVPDHPKEDYSNLTRSLKQQPDKLKRRANKKNSHLHCVTQHGGPGTTRMVHHFSNF